MTINNDLVAACENGDILKAKASLKQGADVHKWDDLALRGAALFGHLDVVNFLREAVGPRYKCHECLIKSTCLKLCEDFQAGEK